MTQYLIREFTDSTGHIHTDIEKAKENETLSIIEAESKEEALEIALISSDKNKESIRKLIKIQRMLG